MKNFFMKGRIALFVIFSVLIVDQVIKMIIKTHMYWRESICITDWFYIYFTENSGMAFGLETFGKPFLVSFRIVAVGVIGQFLYKSVKHGMRAGLIVCVSLILTGALDNIIDSILYGMLSSESTYSQLTAFIPEGGGYAPLLYGRVVDVFYFSIIEANWLTRMSSIGGKHFIFSSSIFNLADAAISCEVIALLLFYSKYSNNSYHIIKKS